MGKQNMFPVPEQQLDPPDGLDFGEDPNWTDEEEEEEDAGE